MGTAITHIRIADWLLAVGLAVEPEPFLVGSVAPDAARSGPEAGSEGPTPSVSHWLTPGGWPQAPENFRRGYLEPRLAGGTAAPAGPTEAAFLAGYYVHLLTDSLFRRYWVARGGPDIWDDPEFTRELAADSQVLDRMYLVNHPESVFFSRFLPLGRQPAGRLPYGLPWLDAERIEEHVRYIARLYGEPARVSHKHVFRRLTDAELSGCITEAVTQARRTLTTLTPPLPAPPRRGRRRP